MLRRFSNPRPEPVERRACFLAAAVVLALTAAAPALAQQAPAAAPAAVSEWRALDPENALVVDTTKGRIIVELAPEIAPEHVKRIKQLVREKFYDGVVWHRVIDWFMAQTGDPLGTGEGQSPYPDLKGEFTFRRGPELEVTRIASPSGQQLAFLRSVPIATQPDDLMALTTDKKVAAWGLYCPGVAGMARGEDNDSANSQFFLMRQPYPSLEKRYTVWGRVVSGLEVVRAIKTGEPVVEPDKMTRVQVLADMPAGERPEVRVLDTRGARFRAMIEQLRKAKGADFSPCDVNLPVQVAAAGAR